MKIGIISDIHDNRPNLMLCLKELEGHGVEGVLCLGDLINPGVARALSQSSIPVFSVWGNNDGDKVKIMQIAMAEGSNLEMSEKTFRTLELEGKKIFLTHHEDFVESLAKSGDFDAVFFGHTHDKEKRKVGECLIVNPGEISTHKTGIASYAVYDTDANDAEIYDVTDAVSVKW